MNIYQRNHLLPFVFLLLVTLLASVTAQPLTICLTNGNYTNNSTYQANLRTLLSNLSANVDSNGFYNASVGRNPSRVNGVVLCRADVQLDFCRRCIHNATVGLVQACPNQRQAVLFDDFCMLRYSNESFIGTMDTSPAGYWWNVQNSTRLDDFMSDVGLLLENISSQASNRGPLIKAAYGSRRSVGFQTIYALEQCTPDLSADDCLSCLTNAIQELPRQFFYGRIGARIVQASCFLRYEVEEFYNTTRLQELLSLPISPPPVSTPPPVASPPGTVQILPLSKKRFRSLIVSFYH